MCAIIFFLDFIFFSCCSRAKASFLVSKVLNQTKFQGVYLAVYLETVLQFNHTLALTLITIFGIAFAFTAPLWGMLSDRIGRRPLLLIGAIVFIVVSYPAFDLMIQASVWGVSIALTLLALPLMAIWGAYGAASPELFATRYRFCGTSISYNIGNSFFGGLIPFFATLLITLSGAKAAPVWLLIIPSIIILPVIYFMPETYRSTLR